MQWPFVAFIYDYVFPVLQKAPVWEITGAEFSKSEMHTADGISIRFPRMTRIRDDKDWKSATNLHQLKVGYQRFWFVVLEKELAAAQWLSFIETAQKTF